MKILVKTAVSPFSGYGNDGIGLITALVDAGLDVYIDPAHVSAPLPQKVADLFTKRLVAPFDLFIQHQDPGQLGFSPEIRRSVGTALGWTMWEYTSLDNLKGRTRLKKKLRDYDLVLGYDAVTTAALAQHTTGPLETLQGGFFPDGWPKVERDWEGDRFGFCMVGQLHDRKDPFAAIVAFKELKEEHPDEFEPAELHLKTNIPGLHSAMEHWVPKLRIHYATWPTEVLREFYGYQHCLLAPSRGEGKNVPALEFLSTGGTVIATNWGGHTQWLSPSIAYPLNYTLAPINRDQPECQNARASKDHLKELMLHVFRNRQEAKRKGELAAKLIPEMCSWDAVVRRLFDKIGEAIPDGGRLVHAARMAQATDDRRVPVYA